MKVMAVSAIILLCSCTEGVVFNRFVPVSREGMDRRDTVIFDVDTISKAGIYTTAVSVRTNVDYPYTKLYLRVEQTVYCRHRDAANGEAIGVRDSVRKRLFQVFPFDILAEDGTRNGDGSVYKLQEKPLFTDTLQEGDSLVVRMSHGMRRECMPGITDLGIKLSRE